MGMEWTLDYCGPEMNPGPSKTESRTTMRSWSRPGLSCVLDWTPDNHKSPTERWATNWLELRLRTTKKYWLDGHQYRLPHNYIEIWGQFWLLSRRSKNDRRVYVDTTPIFSYNSLYKALCRKPLEGNVLLLLVKQKTLEAFNFVSRETALVLRRRFGAYGHTTHLTDSEKSPTDVSLRLTMKAPSFCM